jgi:hypothetical protein
MPRRKARSIQIEQVSIETLNVLSPTVIEVKARLIEVNRKKSTITKIPREYSVHFDAKGILLFGHLHVPSYGDDIDTYMKPDVIPEAVKVAANAKMKEMLR